MQQYFRSFGVAELDSAGEVVGTVFKFDTLSLPLFEGNTRFREKVIRKAAEGALARRPRIPALLGHDPTLVLGSTFNHTLRLWVNEKGLQFALRLADTTLGRDTWNLVRRQDIVGVSFGFTNPIDRWAVEVIDGEKVRVRTLLDFELTDVSLTPTPAYPSSAASVLSPSSSTAPQRSHMSTADEHDLLRRRWRLQQHRLYT